MATLTIASWSVFWPMPTGVGRVKSNGKLCFERFLSNLWIAFEIFDVEICLSLPQKSMLIVNPVYTIIHALFQNVFLTPHIRWLKIKNPLTVLKNTNFKVTYYMYRTIYCLFIVHLWLMISFGNIPEIIFPYKTLSF